jgi:hypothetical protein
MTGLASATPARTWRAWSITPTRAVRNTSIVFTERLAAGASGSVGRAGDAYDSALAE